MKRIMIIDDDVYIGNMLKETLTKEGYEVSRAYSGTEALLLLSSYRPDLILLDLMLPGLSGEEVLPKIAGIPVIVVSARADISDKVQLLLSGAADYITKPFHIEELLARITVQLRAEPSREHPDLLSVGDLRMDTLSHCVSVSDTPIHLTKTEYAILRQLMRDPSRVFTKSHILDLISMDTPDCMESSLKVHISNLRKKLREAGGKDYIESVWGIGFKIQVE
ncbi:MAG: response regulator transcription factor [Clostridiaceae bacterium]|nr:response regulator transcription factor [Clostridiaceae bacterium]